MGIVRKTTIESYWSKRDILYTPFFQKYMSRNRFQLILANLHLNNNANNPAFGQKDHDPLHKIRPLKSMLDRNFKFHYKPNRNIAVDEGGCPFKGRLRFKCYNPNKPNKFAIKTFQVCESSSGYTVSSEVYTGRSDDIKIVTHHPDRTTTTNLVVKLLLDANCLDKGYHVYMDNYYSSPELAEELLFRDTHMCGTIRADRKGLPKAVSEVKFKKQSKKAKQQGLPKVEQSCWRRKDQLLALRWMDKKPVYILSTIHKAVMVKTKIDHKGSPILKPFPVHQYVRYMMGVDLSDQLMQYYTFLRKSCKWWRKLMIHFINMAIMNAYILHKKYSPDRMSHEQFRLCIANLLVEKGLPTCTTVPPVVGPKPTDPVRLDGGRHFPLYTPARSGAIVKRPYRECVVCHVRAKSKKEKSWSNMWCQTCKVVLCAPCFEPYHTLIDFSQGPARKVVEKNGHLSELETDSNASSSSDRESENEIDADQSENQIDHDTDLNKTLTEENC